MSFGDGGAEASFQHQGHTSTSRGCGWMGDVPLGGSFRVEVGGTVRVEATDQGRALQNVLLEAHTAARKYQIRLERDDLKAGTEIPFNTVVGTFPSDIHHEECWLMDGVPYREVILQRTRVMMRPQESQEVSTGYDQDL